MRTENEVNDNVAESSRRGHGLVSLSSNDTPSTSQGVDYGDCYNVTFHGARLHSRQDVSDRVKTRVFAQGCFHTSARNDLGAT